MAHSVHKPTGDEISRAHFNHSPVGMTAMGVTDSSHQGSGAPGNALNAPRFDRRITDLAERYYSSEAATRSQHAPVADSYRSLQLSTQNLAAGFPLAIGVILHAVPHCNWYKVQIGASSGWIGCCHLDNSSSLIIGPKFGSAMTPGQQVLVWQAPYLPYGVILGSIPYPLTDNDIQSTGWLVQGSGAGFKREPAHQQPFKGMAAQGSILDFSASSPLDATALEHSLVTETGIGFLLDAWLSTLSVSEVCGLWMSLWDNWLKLAGWQFDLVHGSGIIRARHDEGEPRYEEHRAVYAHELAGLYALGGTFTETNDDTAIQYTAYRGKIDLPSGQEDIQPVFRVQGYGGYPGQGGQRSVILPAQLSGVRHYSDPVDDEGLFFESIGLDGSYLLQAAKRIGIVKACKIVVPKEMKLPEDGGGDDATTDNYKFAGLFGSGAAHKIGDVQNPFGGDTPSSVVDTSSVEDYIAYDRNWKRLHVFSYHQNDYRTSQVSQTKKFQRTQDVLDFTALAKQPYLDDPQPVPLQIDPRYGEVDYYQRQSFFFMHDDGSVQIGDGYGATLTMSGGHVRITCPGNIELLPGQKFLFKGQEFVCSAEGSIDISSSNKDVRLRAYHNLQILGEDTVLIEAKGAGGPQNYQNKIGEDVEGNGVVIKSAGIVGLLGDDIYLRSSAGEPGNIVLDSGPDMLGSLYINVEAVTAFVTGGVILNQQESPTGPVIAVQEFTSQAVEFSTGLSAVGQVTFAQDRNGGGGLIVDGSVEASGSVEAGGAMADRTGTVTKVGAQFAAKLEQYARGVAAQIEGLLAAQQRVKQEEITGVWQVGQELGSPALIIQLGFSYRDDVAGKQYNVAGLLFPESRWQQLARLGGASGGDAWEENPVSYQGRDLYPWPGQNMWKQEPIFITIAGLTMFDVKKGYDQDRPYEKPQLGKVVKQKMSEGFKVIHPQP